jgi:uncharacterized phage protein gp47/JayE
VSDFPSRLTLYNIGRSYVLGAATKLSPDQVDVKGSDVNLVVGGQSEVNYAVVLQLIQAFNRLTLDGAKGDDLDRYALDRYGQQLPRKGAAASVGSEVFSRLNPNNPAGTIPSGTILLSQAGYQYITLQPASFTTATGEPSDTTCSAPIRAVQAGLLFQAGASTITKFQVPNQAIAFDQTITCTNPVTTAGGANPEDDPTYRNRIRTFWLNARRGILSAIEQGATSVPGVASAYAYEYIGGGGQPVRLVSLSIADPSGVANVQLTQTVQQALNDYRAAGIQVIISPSIPLIVQIILNLTFQAGVDTVTLAGLIQAAIVNYVNDLPVSGTLPLAGLYSVLQRFASQGLIVSTGVPSTTVSTAIPASITSPVGDLVPTVGQTIRTNLTSVVLS